MLGLSSSLVKGGASLLTFVKDNLKLYLDFKSNKSDTLKFPSEGSTEFNGTSDYIDCGGSSTLKTLGNSSFSFSAWINSDLDSSDAWINSDLDSSDDYIFSNSTGTDKGILGRVTSANKFRVLTLTNGSNFDGAESSALSSGWNHVVSSWDGSTMRIYINGTEDTTRVNQGTLGDSTSTNNFLIGRQTNSAGYFNGKTGYFNGKMANLAVWSRALTPEEIQSIMNKSYSQLKGVEKTSLVIWQSLDRNASSGVHNSGYANSAIPETLGSELVKSDLDADDWDEQGTNQVTVDNGVFTITRVDSNFGSRARFTSSKILTETTVNTKIYKASWTSYITGSGTALLPFSFHTSHYDHQLPVNTTSPQDYEVYFIGGNQGGTQQIQFNTPSNVSTVVVSNLSVKEVTSAGFGVQVFPASTSTDGDEYMVAMHQSYLVQLM
jgi:hypothetical protein